MDHTYDTTTHVKNKHLTFEDRVIIQTRLKDGWSAYKIAKYELHCAPNTVRNEIRRGTVQLYNGKVQRYKACAGQAAYEESRRNSRNCYQRLSKKRFIEYVVRHFHEDGWSLDACYGRALQSGEFKRDEMVCTKTLYNYVDLGLIHIKNIDLPEKLRRKPKKQHNKQNKRVLGTSIEERPKSIDSREEFGHWEFDLVIGAKSGEDNVLLTMLERKSRNYFIAPIRDKTSASVMEELRKIQEAYGNHFSQVFKTITTDNGSEFSRLSELEKLSATLVYFAHPYSSYEKGSNERHNRLLRRFIPKGKRIDNYSLDDIFEIEMWCNHLPRKILGYRTPEELFDEELDQIYAA